MKSKLRKFKYQKACVAGHLEQENAFAHFQRPNSFSVTCVAD
jgi:hypothetical protein